MTLQPTWNAGSNFSSRRIARLATVRRKRKAIIVVAISADQLSGMSNHSNVGYLMHASKLELLYELAFLRVFIAWENFLEQTFLRFLCGYQHSGGQESLIGAQYCPTLNAAENVVLGGRQYASWHNPNAVVIRSQQIFSKGRHETVLSSNIARLEHFAAIRHRVAHSQAHAKKQFDTATMTLSGRRYPGSRPGKFLRDLSSAHSPPQRWIKVISLELSGLAGQIAV